jgi:hypothetical protein
MSRRAPASSEGIHRENQANRRWNQGFRWAGRGWRRLASAADAAGVQPPWRNFYFTKSDKFSLNGVGDGLEPGVRAQLPIDVVEMVPQSLQGDTQLPGNFR